MAAKTSHHLREYLDLKKFLITIWSNLLGSLSCDGKVANATQPFPFQPFPMTPTPGECTQTNPLLKWGTPASSEVKYKRHSHTSSLPFQVHSGLRTCSLSKGLSCMDNLNMQCRLNSFHPSPYSLYLLAQKVSIPRTLPNVYFYVVVQALSTLGVFLCYENHLKCRL